MNEQEKSDYEIQAEKFLKETNTEFKAEFLKYDFHFVDDKDKRDIYKITLKRGTREFIFNFGQSINASGEYIFYGENGKEKIHLNKDKKGKLILSYNGVILTKGNSNKNKDFKEPTAYDVLACLQKNEIGTFKNFCDDFGYDTDSRKAETIYQAVLKEYENLKMLYSDDEINKLAEIN